jgi:AAHS family 4-hydroxybenzoate transporter-like MFS transporter
LDIRSELEKAPIGRSHWILVLLLGLVTLFDGYDTFAPSYVIPFALREWSLMPSQAGLLMSSGLIGFMIGSLIVGLIADRIGRKPTLLFGLAVAGLFDLIIAAHTRSFGEFLALRVLAGIGLGMLLPLSVTLINEFAPRRSTNMLIGVMMVGWSGGGVLAALAGRALAPTHGWHWLFGVDGIAFVLVLVCGLFLHESPRFLALKGLQPQVRKVMAWLLPAEAARYGEAEFTTTESAKHKGSVARLLRPDVRRGTLVVWFCAAFSLFAIFGLSTWVPQSMIQRGESFGSSFTFGALLQFMAILGGLGCGWLADRKSRTQVMALGWGLAAVAIAGLALIDNRLSSMVFISIAGFCVMGVQPVLNNFTASLYETEIKSTGVGVELGVGRLGGILGPYIGGWLTQWFPGSLALFMAMAIAVALCAMAIIMLAAWARPLNTQQGSAR